MHPMVVIISNNFTDKRNNNKQIIIDFLFDNCAANFLFDQKFWVLSSLKLIKPCVHNIYNLQHNDVSAKCQNYCQK